MDKSQYRLKTGQKYTCFWTKKGIMIITVTEKKHEMKEGEIIMSNTAVMGTSVYKTERNHVSLKERLAKYWNENRKVILGGLMVMNGNVSYVDVQTLMEEK